LTDESEELTAFALIMEAVNSSETSVSIYQITLCNIPETTTFI
jgi:hypothetical protein